MFDFNWKKFYFRISLCASFFYKRSHPMTQNLFLFARTKLFLCNINYYIFSPTFLAPPARELVRFWMPKKSRFPTALFLKPGYEIIDKKIENAFPLITFFLLGKYHLTSNNNNQFYFKKHFRILI